MKGRKSVRIYHRGKYIHASRTGGIALHGKKKLGTINAIANTSHGTHLLSRIAQGTRVAFQSGKLRLIGRWNAGPLDFNLSETGVSASVNNCAGTFNFLKPQYSSVKITGVPLRGKKAAQIQVIYMSIMPLVFLAFFGIKLLVFLVWMLWILFAFVFDFLVSFVRGILGPEKQKSEATD